jgi:3-oxoacyl-[acyl-carrier protein] reductase
MMTARVALVTGGGRGIGAAICRRLASDGFAVVVNYSQSADSAAQVVAEIEASGGRAIALRANIAEAEEAEVLVQQATEQLGAPTVLVNNAGLNHRGSARSLSPKDWDRVIGVNLSGAFYCTHAALQGMYDAGWGRVIFLGSPSGGRELMPTISAYAAAKAGLVTTAAVIAKEVARRGITVNTVTPGFVATDMIGTGGAGAEKLLTTSWPSVPAEAIANAISWLASDEGAYVSGEEIGVWLGGPVNG